MAKQKQKEKSSQSLDYGDLKEFNDFLEKNAHLITKELLVEFSQHIWDLNKYIELHQHFALDIDFIKALTICDDTNMIAVLEKINIINKNC